MDLHIPEVSAALDTLNRAYHDEIRGWVAEYEKRIRAREFADESEFREALEQDIDGSECVIYTYKARLVGMLSDSYEDARSELSDMGIENPTAEQIAYQCLLLDVSERIDFDDLLESVESEDAND
jgi:hypothetical protein